MNLLDNLAQGLRGAAGVLNPGIQQQTFQQDERRAQAGQQQRMQLLRHLQQQVQAGAIEPEAASILIQRLGAPAELSPVLAGNAGMSVQKQRADMAKEQAYRSAIAQLGPNPTQDQLASLASRFSGPDKTLDVLQKSADRRDAGQQRAIENEDKLRQRSEEFKQRLEQRQAEHESRIQMARDSNATRQQIAQMQVDARRDMQSMAIESRRQLGTLAASLRQPPAQQIRTDENGNLIGINRNLEVTPITSRDGTQIRSKSAAEADQKSALVDIGLKVIGDLEKGVEEDSRSTVGLFSPMIRGTESVVNSVAPGAIGSQATLAKQRKERLISIMSEAQGGKMGKMSNQDVKRLDTAIGAVNSGTAEGLNEGLKISKEILGTIKSKGRSQPSQSGVTTFDDGWSIKERK